MKRKQRYFNVSYVYNDKKGTGYGNCNFVTLGLYPSREFITNWVNKKNGGGASCILNIFELSKADYLNWIKTEGEQ